METHQCTTSAFLPSLYGDSTPMVRLGQTQTYCIIDSYEPLSLGQYTYGQASTLQHITDAKMRSGITLIIWRKDVEGANRQHLKMKRSRSWIIVC